MSYNLPDLGYAYTALEPHIDAATMELHHSKHHKAYVDKFNAAVQSKPEDSQTLEQLFAAMDKLPADLLPAVRNNGGGAWNHTEFWKWMTPNDAQKQLPDHLESAIDANFGSMDKFKELFNDAAGTVFGSGWAWLIRTDDGKLKVTKTANQENPLMNLASVADKGTPLLGLDVWEHAYYLKHQNRRPDYISAFWNVVNWQYVGSLLK